MSDDTLAIDALDRIEKKLDRLNTGIGVRTRVNRYVRPEDVYVMYDGGTSDLTVISGRTLSQTEILRALAGWFRDWPRMHFNFRVPSRDYRIPAWIPSMTLPLGFNHTKEQQARRLAAWNRRCAIIGKCEDRHAVVVVPRRWALPARAILAWRRHRWILEEALIRLGILRSPVECDYYQNYRFDPVTLWGSPLRKHEQHFDRRLGGTVYVSDEPLEDSA